MRRAGNLFEKVTDFHALRAAVRRAARGKRNRAEVARFLFDEELELLRLQRELMERSYRPGSYFTFMVRDPKRRMISAPPFRDRVVHHALCDRIESVLERPAIFDSYACRRGKGTHAAVDRAQAFARKKRFFLKLDIFKYFDSIDHLILKAALRRLIKDPGLLWLLDVIIDHPPFGAPPGKGMPIGNLTSQHFANLYLCRLDHFIKQELRVSFYLRYMDDMVLFGDEKAVLWEWHEGIAEYLHQQLGLALNDRVTGLAPVSEGVPFLGLRIWPGVKRLDARRKKRFFANVWRRQRQITSETAAVGDAEEERLECSMASLFGSTKTADTLGLRRSVVSQLNSGSRSG
jgi:hypothetical protein